MPVNKQDKYILRNINKFLDSHKIKNRTIAG